MLEKNVVNKIKQALEKEYPNCFQFKSHGGKYQKIGLPDIIGCINGIFVGIEVKAPGLEDTLTKIQAENIQRIIMAGGIAFMSTSPEHTIKELKVRIKEWKVRRVLRNTK